MKDSETKNSEKETYTIADYEEEIGHLCIECGCVYVYDTNENLCPACKQELKIKFHNN